MTKPGKAIKYGDHVDTDVIIPARYLNTVDPKELAAHCMEDLDSNFKEKVVEGDLIIAGYNFGCGSSREHAPIAIKASGISCVIAASFARIFYRNSINMGLPIITCPEAVKDATELDQFEVDFIKGRVKNLSRGKTYQVEPFPPFIEKIIAAGGLLPAVKSGLLENGEGR